MGIHLKIRIQGFRILTKTSKTTKSVTIPTVIRVNGVTYKVASIGAKAFNGNKKLTKVNIKSVLLTKKTANKKAFKGVGKKMVIKVPKKVKKAYVKMFKGLKVK